MKPSLDALLFPDDLSPTRRQAVQDALQDDPTLAGSLAHWDHVRAALRADLDAAVPDRHLLVLYTLATTGRQHLLTEEEQAQLGAARPSLERALAAHPALDDVVADLEECCADFESCWAEHFDSRVARRHARSDTSPAAPPRAASRGSRWERASRLGWRVVAPLAVALFVVVAVFVLQRDQALVSLQVAEGTTEVVELADGSTVRLLGGATLAYAAPDEATPFNRRVTLTGAAFFDIVPGQQGFTVETPTGLTTVLGTSFGIQADDEIMQVTLATGKVAVASKAAPDRVVVLEPGQQSAVARNALPTTPQPVALGEALSWTGLFVFRAEPLGSVADVLSQRYGAAITVDTALTDEQVTGTFEQEQGLSSVLATLATTVDATVHVQPDGTYRVLPAVR